MFPYFTEHPYSGFSAVENSITKLLFVESGIKFIGP